MLLYITWLYFSSSFPSLMECLNVVELLIGVAAGSFGTVIRVKNTIDADIKPNILIHVTRYRKGPLNPGYFTFSETPTTDTALRDEYHDTFRNEIELLLWNSLGKKDNISACFSLSFVALVLLTNAKKTIA